MSNNRDFKVKNGIQPTVYHEGLGTVVSGQAGDNLAGASYDSVSFSTSVAERSRGLTFSPDGTKLYNCADDESIYQYDLTTPFDLSTATDNGISFDTSSQSGAPWDISFNSNGTKAVVVSNSAYVQVLYQYSLSTAYNISTASYDSVSFDTSSQDISPTGGRFNNDGTKFFLMGHGTQAVYEYSLSTAFDLSTISYSGTSFDASGQVSFLPSIFFNTSGTKMYLGDGSSSIIYQYDLSTPYSISTAQYSSVSFNVSSQESSPYGLVFSSDGTKMYIGGNATSIFQYSTALNTATLDLSTGSVFEVTPTSDIQVTLSNPADSGTVSGATLLLDGGADTGYELSNASYDSVSFGVNSQAPLPTSVKFDTTGTIMYVMCLTNLSVFQYSLSTAWDISTASYSSKTFSISSQESSPLGLYFSPEGTKMYVSGSSNSVYQYSLSTAWDVSTLSYDSKTFSLASQSIDPYELLLYSSGTKLLVLMNDALYQYSLGTAYDISTASYDSVTTSFSSQDTTMTGFEFNSSGTSLIMLGLTNDKVYQYSLTTPYDITTATYDSVDFSISQDTQPHSVTFGKLGTKMFIMGLTSDTVYQYTVGTPATITYDTAIEWPSGTAPTSPAIGETDVITFNTRDGGITYQGVLAIDGAK